MNPDATFRALACLTDGLTTSEVQSVLCVVPEFNLFSGPEVAASIEQCRGRVSGWKFGRPGSPLLIAVFAYWTHQLENTLPRGPTGRRIFDADVDTRARDMRRVFIDELDADQFEPVDDGSRNIGAWWG